MADGHLNKCKDCHAKDSVAYQQAHREQIADRAAAWRAANPDRWKETARRAQAKGRAERKPWATGERRRQREKAAQRPGVIVSLKAILERDGLHCHICNKPIDDPRKVSYDHVIPISRGGEHSESNLKVAHRSCNAWKHNRLMEELAGVPPIDAPWQERIEAQRNAKRSESMRRAWRELDWTKRNRKISEQMLGNKRGIGNPGRIKQGWGNGFDCCQECGTTERKHKSKGLCDPCYLRAYRAALPPDARRIQVHGDRYR